MEQALLEEAREQAAAWVEAADEVGWAVIVLDQAPVESVFVRVAARERLINKELLVIQ